MTDVVKVLQKSRRKQNQHQRDSMSQFTELHSILPAVGKAEGLLDGREVEGDADGDSDGESVGSAS